MSNNASDYIRTDLDYVILQGISNNDHYALYDKNKKYISGGYLQNNVAINTSQSNYIRFTIKKTLDLEKVELKNGNLITDFVEHKQKDFILSIQQEMLEGDYFVKEEDGWKEVHGWNKYEFTGNENISYSSANKVFYTDMFTNKQSGTNNFIVNAFRVISTDSYANMPNYSSAGNSTSSRVVFKYTELTSIEELKQFLKERYSTGIPITIYYKTITPTKLPCTEEQIAVLEELNNLDLYKPVTNIITTEDIALLKLKYALDVETYVDNKIDEKLANINQQILNIAGGN